MGICKTAVLLSIAAVSAAADAAPIIDQNQPLNNQWITRFANGSCQSFQSQDYDTIVGAGIFLRANPDQTPGDTVRISLWDALPDQFGANMLVQGEATATALGDWVDVFWTETSITPNTEYFLLLECNTDYGIMGNNQSVGVGPYAFGQHYNLNLFPPNPNYSQPQYDLAFRTWTVPTPGAAALLGLGGLMAARRRR